MSLAAGGKKLLCRLVVRRKDKVHYVIQSGVAMMLFV